MSRVLVVGDIHAPAVLPGYLDFCRAVSRHYKTDRTVFIGDLIDGHFATRHKKELSAPGTSEEIAETREELRLWHAVFDEAEVVYGNHDRRHQRRVEEAGIPGELLRPMNDVWETPGWQWRDSLEIDGVLYVHGEECGSGKTPALTLAEKVGRPVVAGHHHSKAGVWWSNNMGRLLFGMNVGCGCNEEHPFFRYASKTPGKGIIGCGIVMDGVPALEVMRGV